MTADTAVQANTLNTATVSAPQFTIVVSQEDLRTGVYHSAAKVIADAVKQVIAESPELKPYLSDEGIQTVDGDVSKYLKSAEPDTQKKVDEMLDEMFQKAAKDLKDEISSQANGSGGKGRNWLAALAHAMGEVAGKHLANSVKLADEIASMEDLGDGASAGARADQAKKMTALQAEMQAETQMFKMAQEALTTIVKSIGEALSSTARKQ